MSITRRDFSQAAAFAAMFGAAWARGFAQAAGPAAPAAAHAMFTNFEDIQWHPLLPDYGPGGPEFVVLRTDPRTQATQLMIRMEPDMYVPRHWHTANETHFMLQGKMIFECGGLRGEQGPGSFNYIPAKSVHQAWSKPGDQAIVLITVDSAWDIHWVDGSPKPPRRAE